MKTECNKLIKIISSIELSTFKSEFMLNLTRGIINLEAFHKVLFNYLYAKCIHIYRFMYFEVCLK